MFMVTLGAGVEILRKPNFPAVTMGSKRTLKMLTVENVRKDQPYFASVCCATKTTKVTFVANEAFLRVECSRRWYRS